MDQFDIIAWTKMHGKFMVRPQRAAGLPGAVLGGVLVGVTESLGAGYLSGSYKDIYAFILLIVVLMVRPAGLFGVLVKTKA